MKKKITVKVIRHTLTRFETGDIYSFSDMDTANSAFNEAVAVLAHSTGNVSKVEMWVGGRLTKYADKNGVFDVKYIKVGT